MKKTSLFLGKKLQWVVFRCRSFRTWCTKVGLSCWHIITELNNNSL